MADPTSRDKELTHDRLTARFDELMDDYDLGRRIETARRRFLGGDLRGKLVLDAGCGVGGVDASARRRRRHVSSRSTSVPRLAATTRERCGCATQSSARSARSDLRPNTFDVVFSTEAIEHTPDPRQSVRNCIGWCKPGGHLALTTPNRLWQATGPGGVGARRSVRTTATRIFSGRRHLRRMLEAAGAEIVDHRGIHLWPFQIKPLHGASRWVDRFGERCSPLMINQCIHCRKPIGGS